MAQFETYTTYIYKNSQWVKYTPYIADTTGNFISYTSQIAVDIPIIKKYQFPTTITSLEFERREI